MRRKQIRNIFVDPDAEDFEYEDDGTTWPDGEMSEEARLALRRSAVGNGAATSQGMAPY